MATLSNLEVKSIVVVGVDVEHVDLDLCLQLVYNGMEHNLVIIQVLDQVVSVLLKVENDLVSELIKHLHFLKKGRGFILLKQVFDRFREHVHVEILPRRGFGNHRAEILRRPEPQT